MASVTIDRIDGVRRDIADAVNRTAPGSTLPEAEQDRLLEQACAETCALLTDWAASPQWQDLGPAQDVLLREALQDQEGFGQLLGPLFGDALERILPAGADGAGQRAERLSTARAEAERAVRGAVATSRRYPERPPVGQRDQALPLAQRRDVPVLYTCPSVMTCCRPADRTAA